MYNLPALQYKQTVQLKFALFVKENVDSIVVPESIKNTSSILFQPVLQNKSIIININILKMSYVPEQNCHFV